MKKEYIKPEMVMEIVILESMFATSSDYSEGMGSNETPGGPNDFNANDRRGTWGSLWD